MNNKDVYGSKLLKSIKFLVLFKAIKGFGMRVLIRAEK